MDQLLFKLTFQRQTLQLFTIQHNGINKKQLIFHYNDKFNASIQAKHSIISIYKFSRPPTLFNLRKLLNEFATSIIHSPFQMST